MPTGTKLNPSLTAFIQKQPLFFVGTAAPNGRVNISPKGMDTLHILNENHIRWLNLSGSGNETAAHLRLATRMTLMFCAFDGQAKILRVYGQAAVTHPYDAEWVDKIANFPELAGSRQIFDLNIDMVQVSCGAGVPVIRFELDRGAEELEPHFAAMGQEGEEAYWEKKNQQTIDGFLSGERPSPLFWLVAVTGFLIIAVYSVVSTGTSADIALYKGDIALFGPVLFASLGYAQGGLLARELGGWQVICWTLVVSLPFLVPLTVVLGDVTAFQNLPMQGWLAFAFLALINSLVGFFFWYRALAIGGVPKISQIQLLQTFFTFGFAALWLNETITLTMILCLIATIVVVWISKKIPVASTAGD